MPVLVTCACGAINNVHEDAVLAWSRCSSCRKPLEKPGGKEAEVTKKGVGKCYFCQEVAKGRKLTYFSGVRMGYGYSGLITTPVTCFEGWKDLMMHDIHACRECQLELWRKAHFLQPIVLAACAALCLLPVVPALVMLPKWVGLALAGVMVLFALGLGAAAGFAFLRYRQPKPDRDRLEEIIIEEAALYYPGEDRAFMTLDRFQKVLKRDGYG